MFSKNEFILYSVLSTIFSILQGTLKIILPSVSKPQLDKYLQVSSNLLGNFIIVTGSNTGIGKSTAFQLSRLGGNVILACRDEKRGKAAAEDINNQLKLVSSQRYPHAGEGNAQFVKLDLGDLFSVAQFINEMKEKLPRVDILVNNAGLNTGKLLPTGLQQLFQVNYLGHYLLVRGLKELLHSSEGENAPKVAKIVNLSSVMHHTAQANFKRSAFNKFTSWENSYQYSYYSDSKLYMSLLTLEMNMREAQRQQDTTTPHAAHSSASANALPTPRRILSVSANPGAVDSDIWRNVPCQSLFKAMVQLVFLSPEQGAATSVAAATMTESCFDVYMQRVQNIAAGRMCQHHHLPYLVPYAMSGASHSAALLFEITGSFAGPQFAGVTLPLPYPQSTGTDDADADDQCTVAFNSPEDLSNQLWHFSASLCQTLLTHHHQQPQSISYLS